MKEYIFLFGKNRDLSILELVSYLMKKELKYHIDKIIDEYAIITIEDFDCKKAINELGGITKIAEYFDIKDIKIYKNKLLYGFNLFYPADEIAEDLKKLFKQEKVKASLKKPRQGNIFSPRESNKLDIELIIFKNKIARVIATSKPSAFKERDENRPYFDKLKVTSLRLCKIFVNITQVKQNETLLDPFVGAGSILQEAMILGINVIGIDNDEKSAEGAIKNLNWIKTKYKLKSNFKVYNIDNKEVDSLIDQVDGVATEPYFGPFFKKIPRYDEIIKLAKEIEKIYFNILTKLKKIVKKNGIIVFPVPVYKTSNGKIKIPFEDLIKKAGFVVYSPEKSIKIPIKYSLKGSIIEREIYIIQNP